MKTNTILTASLLLATTFASVARADEGDTDSGDDQSARPSAVARDMHKTFGADGIAVLPVGDYGKLATAAVGALARLEIPQGPGSITVRGGVLFHAMNDSGYYSTADSSVLMVPIYGGYKYPLNNNGLYVAGELGITWVHVSVSSGPYMSSGSDTELGMTGAIGLKKGQLDLRGGFISPKIGDTFGIMASAGYDFAAF
jgi:hypothetical protein